MIDLHLHLDGSLSAEDVFHLAQISNIKLPTKDISALSDLLHAPKDCESLAQYLEKFSLPLKVLQTATAIEQAVYLLINRLDKQGLCYAEIRFAPQLHTNGGLTQKAAVESAVKGMNKALCETAVKAQLILCCMRIDNNTNANLETVRLAAEYSGRGVCAADLAGDEAAYPTEDFRKIFDYANSLNVPFTIHSGEAAGADSVKYAVDFGAKRIGHGIHAVNDRELLFELKQKNIALEMCFTSNLQTKAARTADDFPLPQFLNEGICATLNTDNTTVSNTDLKNEYKLVQKQFSLSDETMLKIALNAADSAFLPLKTRKNLADEINLRFYDWLKI